MSTADEVAALKNEVASLRRQVRALLVVALLPAALWAVLGLWHVIRGRPGGLVSGEETRWVQVVAQEYHLTDPDGNLRGLWRCPPAGPSFFLLDENGRVAVEVRQLPGGGGAVKVMDASGKASSSLPARLTTPGK
jgi:hypothetical protein